MNKPFLKWAGGKFRLIPELKKHFPEKCRLYIEPFLGAGSVALNMGECSEKIIVNDINPWLIQTWLALQNYGEDFIHHASKYFVNSNSRTEEFYYLYRNVYNLQRIPELFIYLNRHCFNGLCRFNKKGQFNVPFGKYKTVYFPEAEMKAALPLIDQMKITCHDFHVPMADAGAGDLVYCDPPYVPLTATASFVSYSSEGFTHQHHYDLVAVAKLAVGRGATVVISNHDTEFTREIYRDAVIHPVEVNRSISCKGTGRTAAKEIIAIFK